MTRIVCCSLVSIMLVILAGCGDSSGTTLTIGAAISLQPVLDSAVTKYGVARPDVHLVVSYAGSGTIRHQVAFGAPIDLFLSASSEHIDSLVASGSVRPATRTTIAGNTLCLITSVHRAPIADMADLRLPGITRIAIGDPDIVPAGTYAEQTLYRSGLLDDVRAKLVFTRDVQQVLVSVRSGTVDAGFVYASDVAASAPVRLIASVADSLHAPIVYEGVVTSASRYPEAAARFLAYLVSDQVRPIFSSNGFRPQQQ